MEKEKNPRRPGNCPGPPTLRVWQRGRLRQPAPNTAVRLELLNEIINLTSFYLNAHQRDIVSSLVYEAAHGHTSDDPDTVAHSRELLQITRETPRSSLSGKIYQAIVLALVPVICPKSKEVEEN